MNSIPAGTHASGHGDADLYGNPGVLSFPLGKAGGPSALMSRRAAGDMGFGSDGNRARRADWLRSMGFDPSRAMSPNLVHSRDVIAASSPEDASGVDADGIVAPGNMGRGACIVITIADCMPIFLYDAGSGAMGLLHSGWKGTGILAEAVELMRLRHGARPQDIQAVLGPRIGTCCYVVDEERARLFAGEFGALSVSRPDGRPRLDLVAANLGLADRLGLGSVHVADGCTACDDRFGSFRREGAGHFTRMAAAIGYREGR